MPGTEPFTPGVSVKSCSLPKSMPSPDSPREDLSKAARSADHSSPGEFCTFSVHFDGIRQWFRAEAKKPD